MELFFDTETSGLAKMKQPIDHPGQPWIIQLALILSDEDKVHASISFMIQSNNRDMNPHAFKVHQITNELADQLGFKEITAAKLFNHYMRLADIIIAHNIKFDDILIRGLLHRTGFTEDLMAYESKPTFCTMDSSTELCQLPGRYGKFKWPKLSELYMFLFGEEIEDAHDALIDVTATRRCYYELLERGIEPSIGERT